MKCTDLQLGETETLVLLGAGATRGASFVDETTKYKPPVDIDYWLSL